MSVTYRLHNYFRSSASYRVRIAMKLKGLAYEYVSVHLVKEGGAQHGASYRERNPMAQVPTLEIVRDDGTSQHLAQSLAILGYLESEHPKPALLPSDPFLKARAWQLAEIVNAGIQPLQNLETMRYVREVLKGDPMAFTRHFVGQGMLALEAEAARSAGKFLLGDTVTVADCCLVPQMQACRRFGVDLTHCPTLVAVDARLAELPAVYEAHPDRQPDSE